MPRVANIPQGYVRVNNPDHSHIYVKCNYRNRLGQICTFTCRLDCLKYQKNRFHTHTFPIIPTTFLQHHPSITNKIFQLQYKLYASQGISIRAMTSDNMRQYSLALVYFGMELAKDPNANPENSLPFLGRTQFRDNMIDYAHESLQYICNLFKNHTISIMIDGGMSCSKSILGITFGNPYVQTKAYPLKVVAHFDGKSSNYLEVISNLKNDFKDLKIGSVICDNAIAQIKYIDHNTNQQNFFRIPCASHTTHLGFCDIELSLPEDESNIFKTFRVASIFFRSKPISSYFEKRCIKFCPTRWGIYKLIGNWFQLNIDSVAQILFQTPNPLKTYVSDDVKSLLNNLIFHDIVVVQIATIPLSLITNIFEKESFPASKIIPILNQFSDISNTIEEKLTSDYLNNQFSDIQQNAIRDGIHWLQEIKKSVLHRFNTTGNRSLLELIYFLTHKGRKELREHIPSIVLTEDDNFHIELDQEPEIVLNDEEFQRIHDLIMKIGEFESIQQGLHESDINTLKQDPNGYGNCQNHDDSDDDDDYSDDYQSSDDEDSDFNPQDAMNSDSSDENRADSQQRGESNEVTDNEADVLTRPYKLTDVRNLIERRNKHVPIPREIEENQLVKSTRRQDHDVIDLFNYNYQETLPYEDNNPDERRSLDLVSKTLNIIANSLNFNDREYIDLVNQFQEWIQQSYKYNQIQHHLNDYLFWKNLTFHPKFKVLSSVACKLLSAFSSEASVERLFSFFKNKFGDQAAATKGETLTCTAVIKNEPEFK